MRYFDMLASREGPRTRMVTCVAKREQCIAAWPAELAPPTTKTFSLRQDCASVSDAAVADAGGDEEDATGDLAAAGGLDKAVVAVAGNAAGAASNELGAEFAGLVVGIAGEALAADATGKAEIVFDFGAGA